jgi:hypothetical protein
VKFSLLITRIKKVKIILDQNVRNLEIESNLNPSNSALTFYHEPDFNSRLFEGLTTVSLYSRL